MIPTSSLSTAVTVTMPETSAPLAGVMMRTRGAVASVGLTRSMGTVARPERRPV